MLLESKSLRATTKVYCFLYLVCLSSSARRLCLADKLHGNNSNKNSELNVKSETCFIPLLGGARASEHAVLPCGQKGLEEIR